MFRIYVKPGAPTPEVRQQIYARAGKGRRRFVSLNQNVRKFVLDVANQWFGMTFLQVFVAVSVAAAIGLIGSIQGIGIGVLNLYYEMRAIGNVMTGMTPGYEFPAGIAMLLLPVILGAALVASVAPAEGAVRASLVEALEYE